MFAEGRGGGGEEEGPQDDGHHADGAETAHGTAHLCVLSRASAGHALECAPLPTLSASLTCLATRNLRAGRGLNWIRGERHASPPLLATERG